MISEIAIKNFNDIWKLFHSSMLDFRGSLFLIPPFSQYFPQAYFDDLSEEVSKTILHKKLWEWSEMEQSEHDMIIIDHIPLKSGDEAAITEFKDPNVRALRSYVFNAFYNLCCLAVNKKTIEELIYIIKAKYSPKGAEWHSSFCKLLGISRSFLLAEWAREIIYNEVSVNNMVFFKKISNWLKRDIVAENYNSSRIWLGTALLWYLGGKDMPRLDFMNLLRRMNILTPGMEKKNFDMSIHRLKLIKELKTTN